MFAKESIQKLLYFDVETVSQFPSFDDFKRENHRLSSLWEKRCKYYRSSHSELEKSDDAEIYLQKASLEPEFSKIICVSFGSFTDDGNKRLASFCGEDEIEILQKSNKVFNNAIVKNWKICGHNIKGFDVPCLGKRMIYNGINPSPNLQIWDKKPWEIPFVDTSEIFAFGSWVQQKYLSLDLLSCSLGIESPKQDLDGSRVGDVFWNLRDLESIKTYCETDVKTVMQIMEKVCL